MVTHLITEPWPYHDGGRTIPSVRREDGGRSRVTCRTARIQAARGPRCVRQLALPWWNTTPLILRNAGDHSPEDLVRVPRHPGPGVRSSLRYTHLEAKPLVEVVKEADTDGKAPNRADVARSLARAIDILEIVVEGPIKLPELARRTALSTATCYRLARVLAERGLLATAGRSGYRLGPSVEPLWLAYQRQRGTPASVDPEGSEAS